MAKEERTSEQLSPICFAFAVLSREEEAAVEDEDEDNN